jgi:hypothetical protein
MGIAGGSEWVSQEVRNGFAMSRHASYAVPRRRYLCQAFLQYQQVLRETGVAFISVM